MRTRHMITVITIILTTMITSIMITISKATIHLTPYTGMLPALRI